MKQLLTIIIALLIASTSAYGQLNRIRFDHLSLKEGLSQSSVNCIVQDANGFLWFGTYSGLNRYDGYSIKHYKTDLENGYHLSSNLIRGLIVDHENVMWVGTMNGGLARYDDAQDKFVIYKHHPNDPHSLSDDNVLAIFEDSRHNLWIGTQYGSLNRFDRDTQQFIHYGISQDNPNGLGQDHILSIGEDSLGNIWIGTEYGLYRYNEQTNQFHRYLANIHNTSALLSDLIYVIYRDHSGTMWFGTANGLHRYDAEHDRFIRELTLANSTLDIRAIHEDRFGDFWIGTSLSGLFKFDRKTKSYMQYKSDPADIYSLSSSLVSSIYEDKSGVLWIGTDMGGVNKYNYNNRRFPLNNNQPDLKSGVDNSHISCIAVDHKGIVWCGTRGGGFFKFDPNDPDEKFHYYVHIPDNPSSLCYDFVNTIAEDTHGYLWIGTTQGLSRFDKDGDKSFRNYFTDFRQEKAISNNVIWSLYQDRRGNLWVGTYNEGLNLYDENTDTFIHYRHDPQNSASISDDVIWSMLEDSRGIFWIGTERGGLNRFDRESGTFISYIHSSKDSFSVSDNKILVIFEDSNGTIWIGTDRGLDKCISDYRNPDSMKFVNYNEKDGLPHNSVQGILEDDHGYLWISTKNGISKFNPRTESFENFNENDGLQDREFSVHAATRLMNGKMLFGGINGFNIFNPDSVRNNTVPPQVVITDFKLSNSSVPINNDTHAILKKSIWETDTLMLSYKNNVISFEFAALHYVAPQDNQYKYMLEGFEKNWNYTDATKRFVTYTNLRPGGYIFRVKASNNDNVWSKQDAKIYLIITPPFWMRWWFRVLAFLLMVGSLSFWYHQKIKRIDERRKELEHQVKERTAEIVKKNEALEKQKSEIQKNARKLMAANDKLLELDQFKESMTGMIVHDLKNMLNSIIGLSETANSGRELEVINQYSKQMLNLVMNILDVQKFEDTEVKLALSDESVYLLIQKALGEVNLLIAQKHLKIVNWIKIDCFAHIDEDLIKRVLVNLLTNAIKYSPMNGKITIDCTSDREFIRLAIIDEGPGIPEDKHEMIFQKYSQVAARKVGSIHSTGLGLAFCKMAVEAHQGRIGVVSKPDAGSTFWFTMPISTEIPKKLPEKRQSVSDANDSIVLKAEEKAKLVPYIEQLKLYEIYEVSDLRNILKELDVQSSPNLQAWKMQINEAIHNSNEEKYNELINI
ncbi:hypothetical protein JW960_27990 [candidate division KSB1 bacterium]|nr:hypothetical protein [candidate division KSB1 bacterium]